jgi:ferredoxin
MTVTVTRRCTACGACLATCPEQALLPAPRRPVVDALRCTDCLACIEICPVDAVVTLGVTTALGAGPSPTKDPRKDVSCIR